MSLEDEEERIEEDAGPNLVRWLIRLGRGVWTLWRERRRPSLEPPRP